MGYQINEYNCCVMNNIIDNNQCYILWNANDLKTSHVDTAIFPAFFLKLMQNMGRFQK